MKKYILSLFVLVFAFGLFNINATHADMTECAPGHMFSIFTGKPCSSVAVSQDNSSSGEDLKYGSRGESVKAFQQMLRDEGFLFGRADGIYGRMTDGAANKYFKKYPCYLGASASYIIGRICPPTQNPNAPVISGVSGPQTLNVNETGTWTVTAYDKSGGNLSYSATWGDENIGDHAMGSAYYSSPQQTNTITHIYRTSGIYNPTFIVTNQNGQSAKTSLSVNVGNVITANNLSINPSSATIKAGETTRLQALLNTCPAGAQCFVGPLPVQATWTSSNTNVATVAYDNDCPPGVYCTMVAREHVNALVTGVGEGSATITATYTNSSGVVSTATALITVYKTTSSTVTVLSPNGGETWVTGTTQTIKWQDNGAAPAYDIYLQAYRAPCTSNFCPMYMTPAPRTIAKNVMGSFYNWTIPNCYAGNECSSNFSIPAGSYVIQVCQTSTSNCDSSDSYFKIANKNSLAITTSSPLPNAKVGQPYSVALNVSGGAGSSSGYSWGVGNGVGFPVSGLGLNSSFGNPVYITGTPAKVYINGIEQMVPYTFTFNVTVNTGYESTVKTFTLTVDPATTSAPVISYIFPFSGSVGAPVTIMGTGFTSTGNQIKFGNLGTENNPAYNLSSNGASISFTVPSSNYFSCWDSHPACMVAATMTRPGVYPVSVINANGTSNAVNFTVTSH